MGSGARLRERLADAVEREDAAETMAPETLAEARAAIGGSAEAGLGDAAKEPGASVSGSVGTVSDDGGGHAATSTAASGEDAVALRPGIGEDHPSSPRQWRPGEAPSSPGVWAPTSPGAPYSAPPRDEEG